MVVLPSLITLYSLVYEYDPSTSAGDSSPDQEEMGFWTYFHNTQVESSHAIVAVLSSHTFALEDTTRIRTIPN
jgi:hypothetical protein